MSSDFRGFTSMDEKENDASSSIGSETSSSGISHNQKTTNSYLHVDCQKAPRLPRKVLQTKCRSSEIRELTCGVCKTLFTKPIILVCGHSFCEACLKEDKDSKCHQCGHVNFGGKVFIRNKALENIVNEYRLNYCIRRVRIEDSATRNVFNSESPTSSSESQYDQYVYGQDLPDNSATEDVIMESDDDNLEPIPFKRYIAGRSTDCRKLSYKEEGKFHRQSLLRRSLQYLKMKAGANIFANDKSNPSMPPNTSVARFGIRPKKNLTAFPPKEMPEESPRNFPKSSRILKQYSNQLN